MTDALKIAREALAKLGAAHAWLAFGECRAYDAVRSGPLLSSAEADAKARAVIAAIDAQQAAPTVKRYCCYGAAAEVGCDDDCPTKRAPPAPTVTGGSPEHLLQDHDRGLSQWLASKPDARLRVREACADIAAQQAATVGAPKSALDHMHARCAADVQRAFGDYAATPPAVQAQAEQHPTRADLLAALTFYADGLHFDRCAPDEWDTVSDEPQNWWCDEAGTATIEDGTIAKRTLSGDLTAADIDAMDEDGAAAQGGEHG